MHRDKQTTYNLARHSPDAKQGLILNFEKQFSKGAKETVNVWETKQPVAGEIGG